MSWSGMTVISEAAASNERIQHQHVSSTTSRPPLRTPDHYEMIDQIGKGTYSITNVTLRICNALVTKNIPLLVS